MLVSEPMDMIKVKYFLQIADAGSMAAAAKVLNISPSALSKATHLLEEQLGVNLITHSGRKIVITDAGRLLAQEARSILRDMHDLKNNLVKKSAPKELIKIATFEVFSTYFLSFLNETHWDDYSLKLYDVGPGELEQTVVDGRADFGITYLPMPRPELDFLKITEIEMGVYTSTGAFQGRPQIDLPFVIPITPISGHSSRIKGLDGWPDHAYQRKVKYQVTLMESALELVRQGRAAGYFPKFIVHEHNQRFNKKYHLLRRRSPYGNQVCTTDVYIIKRISDIEGTQLKQLARGVRKICSR